MTTLACSSASACLAAVLVRALLAVELVSALLAVELVPALLAVVLVPALLAVVRVSARLAGAAAASAALEVLPGAVTHKITFMFYDLTKRYVSLHSCPCFLFSVPKKKLPWML